MLRTFAVAVRRFLFSTCPILTSLREIVNKFFRFFSIFFSHSSQDEKIEKSSPKNDSFFCRIFIGDMLYINIIIWCCQHFFNGNFFLKIYVNFLCNFCVFFHCCLMSKILITLLLKCCLCTSMMLYILTLYKSSLYYSSYYK